MKSVCLVLLGVLLAAPAAAQTTAAADVVSEVRTAISAGDLAASLGKGALDREPRLATAVGAGIEVQAQVRGQRGSAQTPCTFLQQRLEQQLRPLLVPSSAEARN